MEKLTNEQIKSLILAGESDNYTEQVLYESAVDFIEKEMPEILENGKLTGEAINYYKEAFLGWITFGKCKKCGQEKVLYSDDLAKDVCLDCRNKNKN